MSVPTTSVLKIAPPYDDALLSYIAQGFSKKLGFEVRFEAVEDPALLCGFIAYIQGTVYDTSGKTQLENLKEHLLDAFVAPTLPPREEEDA